LKLWYAFGPLATIALYALFVRLHRRTRALPLLPVVATPLALIALISLPGGDVDAYAKSTHPFVWLLGPATIALAIPLARKRDLVRRHLRAILAGVVAGAISGGVGAVILSRSLGLSHGIAATLAPKSVTTPIAMPIAERLGGTPPLTAAVVIVTGVIGYAVGPWFLHKIGVHDPIARGVALGTAAHGVGTAKALEESDAVGAASGIAMVISGVVTALIAPLLGWLAWR
jgi:predicted murein hydrolase (TIGR00659 family)